MKTTSFYVLFDKQEKKFTITVDRKKVAQLIGVHTHTIKYRLRNGCYEDNKVIIGKSNIIQSVRGENFGAKKYKSRF